MKAKVGLASRRCCRLREVHRAHVRAPLDAVEREGELREVLRRHDGPHSGSKNEAAVMVEIVLMPWIETGRFKLVETKTSSTDVVDGP